VPHSSPPRWRMDASCTRNDVAILLLLSAKDLDEQIVRHYPEKINILRIFVRKIENCGKPQGVEPGQMYIPHAHANPHANAHAMAMGSSKGCITFPRSVTIPRMELTRSRGIPILAAALSQIGTFDLDATYRNLFFRKIPQKRTPAK
jgi:hypothetical protein